MKPVWSIIIGWILAFYYASPVSGQSKFSLSASFAPIYTYHNVQYNQIFPSGTSYITESIITRSTGQGYSVGLLGRYSFSDHWSASAGLWMSYIHTNTPTIIAPPTVDYVSGPSHSRTYQIPVLINYQLSKRRLTPYFSAGAQLSFQATTFMDLGNGNELPLLLGRNKINVLPTVGAGILYHLTHQLALSGQPTISFDLPESSYAYYHSYRLSFQTQLLYTF